MPMVFVRLGRRRCCRICRGRIGLGAGSGDLLARRRGVLLGWPNVLSALLIGVGLIGGVRTTGLVVPLVIVVVGMPIQIFSVRASVLMAIIVDIVLLVFLISAKVAWADQRAGKGGLAAFPAIAVIKEGAGPDNNGPNNRQC